MHFMRTDKEVPHWSFFAIYLLGGKARHHEERRIHFRGVDKFSQSVLPIHLLDRRLIYGMVGFFREPGGGKRPTCHV